MPASCSSNPHRKRSRQVSLLSLRRAGTIVWSFDNYEKAHAQGGALVKQGKKTWTFVTAHYVFGHSLEEQTANVVKSMGGKVKGVVRCPFEDTTNF